MNIFVKVTDPTKTEADAVVVFVCPEVAFSPEATKLDHALGGVLQNAVRSEGFTAEAGKTFVIHTHGKIAPSRVILTGVGDLKKLCAADIQRSGAAAVSRAKTGKAKKIAVALSQELDPQSVTEGVVLGNYHFTRHKTVEKEKQAEIEECILLTAPNKLNAVTQAVALGESVAQGVLMARDLVNEPPSLTTPTYLADVAKSLAKSTRSISCEVFGKSDMEKMGMGGLLAIARGSSEEPKFIKVVYKGGGRKTIALVGKGITFDTGGLSLKPRDSMETMKLDMAGAATVIGIIKVASQLKLPVNLVGLIPATENLPSGKAIKPGDIIHSRSGKTIEIVNTDAEGRLVLADALDYAKNYKPALIMDFATLTGAIVVALGDDLIGAFANRGNLLPKLRIAAEKTGEKLWPMPLEKDYEEFIKSDFADLRNIGTTRYGDSINAANFLKEFVGNTPWVHFDIAGVAWTTREKPYRPKGATGTGVRLAIEFLKKFKR